MKGASASPHRSRNEGRAPKKDREKKRKEAEWRNRFSQLRAPLETSVAQIEGHVDQATRRLEEIQDEMGNPEIYRDPGRVRALQEEFGSLKSRIAAWSRQWEEFHLKMDSIEEQMTRERPV